jgi:hypothetical protein
MNNELRALVDLRDRTLQKSRIAFGNRVSAIDRGADDGNNELVARWQERFDALEKEADADIYAMVKDIPIVNDLDALKGIGPLLAAKLVSMIDIERADTVSALWRYAGYAVIDGARERPMKGEKLHYNARLKSTCYLIGTSFLKCNSPYRQIYDEAREFYDINRTDWTKLHKYRAALRKMIKIFLSHLWEQWRERENLSVDQAYILNLPEHTHKYQRSEFGWPIVESSEGKETQDVS